MARPVILSNSQMMVGLNEQGLVHDFYYPYVGLENLTTARSLHHKIGIWVDGVFSWVDDGSWNISVNFEDSSLISSITMANTALNISLRMRDFIDTRTNCFMRRIQVTNPSDKNRNVRIFMHQVFQISHTGRADTALYVPDENYILDYKGRCALLIYGEDSNNNGFDQYAVGNFGIESKAGTYFDAEDGELSNNAVEHGGVDSVVRFSFSIEPNSTSNLDYWIIASASQYECEAIHSEIKQLSVDKLEERTRKDWSTWLAISNDKLSKVDSKYLSLTRKSLMIIKAHTDKRGGILASGDSSIFNYGRDYYCYCWPRDGAYVIWPLIRLGYKTEPKKFFEFCRDTLDKGGYLMHKYQPDRAIGSTWHPLVHDNRKELAIQEDETAIVIAMLGEYLDNSSDDEFVQSLYATLIQPMANFMAKFIDEETSLPHASYDLWEEKFLTNTYTAVLTAHALRRAASFAQKYEYPDDAVSWLAAAERISDGLDLLYNPDSGAYRKGLYIQPNGNLSFDNTVDISSMYGVMMFGQEKLQDERLSSTVKAIEAELRVGDSIGGGIARYQGDNYMKTAAEITGNPWFVCTLWLAQYYSQEGNYDKAQALLDWTLNNTIESGVLSEQINPTNGAPVGVAPLVWSHAEFINTVLDLNQ
jgi:GH15 family glucan-1,4-alpha-glucosidase